MKAETTTPPRVFHNTKTGALIFIPAAEVLPVYSAAGICFADNGAKFEFLPGSLLAYDQPNGLTRFYTAAAGPVYATAHNGPFITPGAAPAYLGTFAHFPPYLEPRLFLLDSQNGAGTIYEELRAGVTHAPALAFAARVPDLLPVASDLGPDFSVLSLFVAPPGDLWLFSNARANSGRAPGAEYMNLGPAPPGLSKQAAENLIAQHRPRFESPD